MIARIKGLRIQELRDCKQEVSSEKRGVCSMHRDEPKRQLHNFFNPFVETQELVLPEDETAWRILLEMAERARQLPVLAERLKQFDVPQKARDELTFAKSRTVAISAMHQELIHKISDAFTETGIQFQVLKGVVWSRLLHRKLGLRQTGDLDVLVMAKDLRKAEEVLNKLGYFRDALRIDEYYEANSHQISLYNDEAIIDLIEVHWNLGRPDYYPISEKLLWEAPQSVALLNNTRVMTLSPELTLILMILHLVQHNFLIPYSLIDLLYGWFVYKDKIDFTGWQNIVRDIGMMGAAITAFSYMEGVFGIESPFEEDVKWFQHPAKNHYSSQYWTDEEPCFSAKIFSRLLVDRADNVISSMFRTFFPSVHLMKKLYPQNGNKPLSPYFQHYKYLALRLTR